MEAKFFFIARIKDWNNGQIQPIHEEEWKAFVENHDSLESTLLYKDNYGYKWKGPTSLPDPDLYWNDGRIIFLSPDKVMLKQMIHIASQLGAIVHDNEGKVFQSVEDIPDHFDDELNQQREKEMQVSELLLKRVPRCLSKFDIADRGASEVGRGGHGEPLNIGYLIQCKQCGSQYFSVDGYYWFNDHYKKKVFVAPLHLQCEKCGSRNLVFHPGEHGYDPEACDSSHTDFSKKSDTRSATYQCETCQTPIHNITVWFSYSDDIFDEEEFEDFVGREQDLFSWISFEGKCKNCNNLNTITDFECA